MKIEVNVEEFSDWLQSAWCRQHDGYDRGYWYNPKTQKCVSTCETKTTEHNPSGELILIAWVNGDNNVSYDDICLGCSSYLGRNEETGEINHNSCEAWKDWYDCELEYTNNPSFKNMQFECMENVRWVDNVKVEAPQMPEGYEIEWV